MTSAMSRCPTVLSLLLVFAVLIPSAEPEGPIASAAFADGKDFVSHANASLFGTLWREQALAPLRSSWGQWVGAWKAEGGVDLEAVIMASRDIRLALLGFVGEPQPMPQVWIQADLGEQADAVYLAMTKAYRGEVAIVAGANAAWRLSKDVQAPVLARHGTRLVIGFGCPAIPAAVTPVETDVHFQIDYPRLIAGIITMLPEQDRAAMERNRKELLPWLGQLTWQSSMIPVGIHDQFRYSRAMVGLIPVDRALLDRFPQSTILMASVGIDLQMIWQTLSMTILDFIGKEVYGLSQPNRPQVYTDVDAAMVRLGLKGINELMKGVKGTVALGITAGQTYPEFSLVVPRSLELDILVKAGVEALKGQLPDEKSSTVLPLPMVPMPVVLARDAHHWLVTTDPQFATHWLSGASGGFMAAAVARVVMAKAPANAYALGVVDVAAAARMGRVFGALAFEKSPETRNTLMVVLDRLAVDGAPSWAWAGNQNNGVTVEAQGPLGAGILPFSAMTAASIIQLDSSRRMSNMAAAAHALRNDIFAGQIQFQAAAYRDGDGDGVGEFGTIGEMSGQVEISNSRKIPSLLQLKGLKNGTFSYGYMFQVFLPDGAEGALSSDMKTRADSRQASDAQEKHWIAYAYPLGRRAGGDLMFAIGPDGIVRAVPWVEGRPSWNSALPKGWGAESNWPVYLPKADK